MVEDDQPRRMEEQISPTDDEITERMDFNMPGAYPKDKEDGTKTRQKKMDVAATTHTSQQHRHAFDASEAESFEPLLTLLPDSPDFDEIMDELAMLLYAQDGALPTATKQDSLSNPTAKMSTMKSISSAQTDTTGVVEKATSSDIPSAWSDYVQNIQYSSQEPSKTVATVYAVDTLPGAFPNIDYNALDYDNLGQLSGLIDSAAGPSAGHNMPYLIVGPTIASLVILCLLGHL